MFLVEKKKKKKVMCRQMITKGTAKFERGRRYKKEYTGKKSSNGKTRPVVLWEYSHN